MKNTKKYGSRILVERNRKNRKLFHWRKQIVKKHKKVCKILNHTEHLLILVSTVTGSWYCLVGIPESIASTAIRTNISIITAGIKNYESTTTKKDTEKW